MEGHKIRRRLAARMWRPGYSGFGLVWGDSVAGVFVLVGSWALGVQVCYQLVDKDGLPVPLSGLRDIRRSPGYRGWR